MQEERPYLAKIDIPAGSGQVKINTKSDHVDFWMYENYDPVSHVTNVERLNNA